MQMGEFKVGDRVRSLDSGYSVCGQVGVVTSLAHNNPGYMVTFDPDMSGPLFHHPHEVEAENTPRATTHDTESTTLRDQFAMAALTGLCGNCDSTGMWQWTPAGASARAYEIASEMMAERERGK